MSETYTYPGIYLTETADIPRTVTPATTSLTAIMGMFPCGPVDRAVLVSSLPDFQAQFGGDTVEGLAPYAVQQFFLNGGSGAWIVRLTAPQAALATVDLGDITITAGSPGSWANAYTVALTASSLPTADPYLEFTLTKGAPAAGTSGQVVERIPNLPADNPAQLARLITAASRYVAAAVRPPAQAATGAPNPQPVAATGPVPLAGGSDGDWGSDPTAFQRAVYVQLGNPEPPAASSGQGAQAGPGGAAAKSGPGGAAASGGQGSGSPQPGSPQPGPPQASPPSGEVAQQPVTPLLDLIAPQVFNLLCIPDLVWLGPSHADAVQVAHKYAASHQAFLLVDPPPPEAVAATGPAWSRTTAITPVDNVGVGASPGFTTLARTWGGNVLNATRNAGAVYYPWLLIPDPASSGAQVYVPPSGTVAGIYAATDASRGVWKAPAGIDASLTNVNGLADTSVNDTVNGRLNILGINAIRTFPIYGTVVWGARTLAGSDLADSAWKYVPVRRLTDFIEQTLLQSLRWAIFEPNGPALWGSISLEVGAFMSGLYSAGAFFGATAARAYQVACDATTTSEADILSGIVRVHVGFQPVEPAEFIVLSITLNAGPAAS